MRILQFYRKKLLSRESASSTLIAVLIAMPLLLLALALAIDLSKNAAVMAEYRAIGQEAANSAIRWQSGSGSLLCGQSISMEDNPSILNTPRYTVSGVTNLKRLAQGDFSVLSGTTAGFREERAQAISHAARAYLEKTGRIWGAGATIYNTHNGKIAAANDGNFVRSMRSMIGNDSQIAQLEENKPENVGLGHFDKTPDGNNQTMRFTIWCSKGVASNTKAHDKKAEKNTVGAAERFNTVNLSINDWSGNFMLGMFNKNLIIQRYRITPRAVASWSQNSVK